MGFFNALGKGLATLHNSAEERIAKNICGGDPVRNAPDKVREILRNMKNGQRNDDEVYRQRVNALRVIMSYLARKAVDDRNAEMVRSLIVSKHGSELMKHGIEL
ncbi:MAG: hypothetical protein FWG63_10135 [Defluviitaleaceae bacterium]|nr:hypothetical protein [Defluviitaleaceae bacterium]